MKNPLSPVFFVIGFLIGVFLLPNFSYAQTSTSYSDSFYSFNSHGWRSINGHPWVATSSLCPAGTPGCIWTNSDINQKNIYQFANLPITGSIFYFQKSEAFGSPSAIFFLSDDPSNPVDAIGVFSNPVPKDNTYHEVFFAWRKGSVNWETCSLLDSVDTQNCSWIDTDTNTGVPVPITTILQGVSFQTQNGTIAGNNVWISEFGYQAPQQAIDYSQFGIATSSIQIQCSGIYATSTGFFSDISNGVSYGLCTSFAFLFIPNQQALQNFQTLTTNAQGKIPFSYVFAIQGIFNGMSASSSTNLPTWSIDLSTVNLGSSTPMGILFNPQITFLSTTTISKYLPDSTRSLMLTLMSFGIWVLVIIHVYHRIIPHKPTL